MADLINVNWKEHRNYKYIEASDFDFDEIGEVIGSRKRFSEVVKLREKLSAMDEDDLRDLFSKRFIINAPTENDALLAMLALYDTISAASPGELIVEKNGSAMPMTFGGFGVSQDFPGMGADDDPQFTEQLSSRGNPRCVHINSAYMFSSVVTELDKQGEITFVLNVQSDSGMMSVFGEDNSEGNFEKLGSENGYTCVRVNADTAEDINEMMTEKFEQMKFDISGVRKELEQFCKNASFHDEYHLDMLMRGIINSWLLSGREERVITRDDIVHLTVKPAVAPAEKKQTQLVGLTEERGKIDGIAKMISFEQKRRELGICGEFNGCNMVFAGPPGTAKTTLAREFAQKLADNHIISSAGNFKECRKSDLVGMFVGWTASMIDNMFERMNSMGGGVIFFDEIYTIAGKNSTCFDDEAVTCIVQNMENYRGSVFCIFAGYEDKMDQFLSSNPGIRSRIHFTVKFSHYDNDTLVDITKSICGSCGFDFPAGSEPIVSSYFDRLRAVRGDQFGNGREARNLISNATQKMAVRMWDIRKPTVKKLRALSAEDLQLAAEDILSSEIRIGGGNGGSHLGF